MYLRISPRVCLAEREKNWRVAIYILLIEADFALHEWTRLELIKGRHILNLFTKVHEL